jgi:hypothetical protein
VPQQNITCDTLGELNGGIARAIIDANLHAALRDFDDRAHEDKKPRVVTITVTMAPLNNGQMASNVKVKTSMPAYQTNDTIHNIVRRPGGVVEGVFSTTAPEQPNQRTIEDEEGEQRQARRAP